VLRRMVLYFCLWALVACAPEPPMRIGANPWPGYAGLFLLGAETHKNHLPGVVVKYPSSSEAAAAMRRGELDVVALTLDETLLLAESDIDFKVVAVLDSSLGADVLLAQPGVSGLSDLKGRRIAVEQGALGAYMLVRTLQQARLKAADVQIVNAPLDAHEQLFRQKMVDAVITFEPVRSRLLRHGAKILFDSRQIPHEIVDVLLVRWDVLKRRPDDVRQLLALWLQQEERLQREEPDALQKAAFHAGLSLDEFVQARRLMQFYPARQNRLLLQPGNRLGLEPLLGRVALVAYQHGLLKSPNGPRDVLSPDYLPPGPVQGSSAGLAQ
jgi:NitT/TauT family transport system substrate-binding protein